LRRDRAALALSFILPIAFFSIFAVIFGGQHDSTSKITSSWWTKTRAAHRSTWYAACNAKARSAIAPGLRPKVKRRAPLPEYTAATAEAAVKAGDAPVALIIPHGFGDNPISFGGESATPAQRFNCSTTPAT
jgi:ABC-2 type transport system permease protein